MTVEINTGETISLTTFQRYFVKDRFGYFPERKYFKMVPCGVEFKRRGFALHYKKDRETGEITVGFEANGGGAATKYYTKKDFEI